VGGIVTGTDEWAEEVGNPMFDGDDREPDYDDPDDEPCRHDHDEECEDEWGYISCSHQHCFNCGGCQCPGYCDDFKTYNLRPAETGGAETAEASDG
jgi:hypothetical protein